jgi:hypothetical protein
MAVQDDEEPPLDPAQERLRQKLVRLLFVSGGIMMLGLIAVFAAIVYKLSDSGPEQAPAAAGPQAAPHGSPLEATIAVPRGARVLSADLDGERALLRLEGLDGSVSLVLVDLATGRVLGRYAIRGE